MRTFATALRQLDNDPEFVFTQSQPQLYAWVFATDDDVAARVRAHAASRWDASVASMWVEPDLHAPSGESVLRQFAHGMRWTREQLGVEPSVAWLPDTFGFPSTFPQLAAHAGIAYFATTKLQWNDTTRWPYPQFRWHGDDGSTVIGAMLDAYEGGITDHRVTTATARDELLVVGYGDGGGGATDEDLAHVGGGSRGWTRVDDWFRAIDVDGAAGPPRRAVPRDTPRHVHDASRRQAAQRAARASTRARRRARVVVRRGARSGDRTACARGRSAQRVARRAARAVSRRHHGHVDLGRLCRRPPGVRPRARDRRARRRVGRPRCCRAATCTRRRRRPSRRAATATAGCSRTRSSARAFARTGRSRSWERATVRTSSRRRTASPRTPTARSSGTRGTSTPRTRARRCSVKPGGCALEEGELVVRLAVGRRSKLAMRVALHEEEPWVRVDAAVAWHESHVLLRAEHRVAVRARDVRYGQQHGTLCAARTRRPTRSARSSKFRRSAGRT